MEPEKSSFFSTRYIKFLGGRNTIFSLVLLLIIGLVILILFKESLTTFFYPILVYAFIVIFMMISSLGMQPMVRIGAIVFFVSDLLLGVGLAGFGNPVLSFISLGLYYIAICILANTAYKRTFE